MFNLNDKRFTAKENSESGEVSSGTVFHYYQESNLIWADYSGGSILKGQLIGRVLTKNTFEIRYQHINQAGEIKTGYCKTIVSKSPKGLQLDEKWEWTSGGKGKGTSVLVELTSYI